MQQSLIAHSQGLAVATRASRYVLVTSTLAAGLPGMGHATCSFAAGSTGNITVAVPSRLSVPRDIAVGSVIYTSASYAQPFQISVTCSGDPLGISNNLGLQPGVGTDAYPIANTGLSWQYVYNGSAAQSYGSNSQQGTAGFGGTTHAFRLVVAGPIAAGAVVPAGKAGGWNFGTINALNLVLSNAITVVPQLCSTARVDVDLGKHKTSEFSGVGSRASATPFSIPLNGCPGGLASIKFKVDPVSLVASDTNSVVGLDSASTAKGVGIQVQDNAGNALPFGKEIPFSAYSGAAGNYAIPLRAAYYQTQPSVVPGSANGALQFTLIYQ